MICRLSVVVDSLVSCKAIDDLTRKSVNNTQDLIMETKQQSQKPAKKEPVKTLPVVPLSEDDMSSVSGGGGISSL
jgi:hypothetical protein